MGNVHVIDNKKELEELKAAIEAAQVRVTVS